MLAYLQPVLLEGRKKQGDWAIQSVRIPRFKPHLQAVLNSQEGSKFKYITKVQRYNTDSSFPFCCGKTIPEACPPWLHPQSAEVHMEQPHRAAAGDCKGLLCLHFPLSERTMDHLWSRHCIQPARSW